MQSQSFDIGISKMAMQVWILILVPISFVFIPLLFLLNFDVAEWLYYVIFFSFIIASLFCTIKMIKFSTRKGILVLSENGLQFIFNNKSIFYNQLNNIAISWDEVNKVAYNFDANHNLPYIVFKFQTVKGAFICMQEESSVGMDETNWPLWLALDGFVSDYNHVHKAHKIINRNFLDSKWFMILMWFFTMAFFSLIFYNIINPNNPFEWYNILRLLFFIIPAHLLYWANRKKKLANRSSDN